MRVLDLFSAAAGGWSLGLHRAGYTTVAACELIEWRRILYSQNNPGVRLYDDVSSLTAERLLRDLGYLPSCIVGSPPCQDISTANTSGKGIEGERSKLYLEAIRLVGECRPRWFAFENSSNLRTRGADAVLAAVEAIGYTCWPVVVRAGDVGANHERPRSWLIGCDLAQVTDPDGHQLWQQSGWGSGASGRDPAISAVDALADAYGDGRAEGWSRRWGGLDLPNADDHHERAEDGNASQDGCGQGRSRRCAEPASGLSVPTCGNAADAPEERHEAWAGDAEGARREVDRDEPADRAARSCDVPHTDREGQSHRAEHGEVGGSASIGRIAPEPWSEWNGGLAGHLRVDDGLSAWVAGTRVALGGPKGTSAASLIVEAFGDAVVPQIPEAIGRAILRTEAALSAVLQTSLAA